MLGLYVLAVAVGISAWANQERNSQDGADDTPTENSTAAEEPESPQGTDLLDVAHALGEEIEFIEGAV